MTPPSTKPHVCIDNWEQFPWKLKIRMCGDVKNHPRLRDTFITTTSIIASDPDGVWVETKNTVYILGTPKVYS